MISTKARLARLERQLADRPAPAPYCECGNWTTLTLAPGEPEPTERETCAICGKPKLMAIMRIPEGACYE
jgi:hypothetical protein